MVGGFLSHRLKVKPSLATIARLSAVWMIVQPPTAPGCSVMEAPWVMLASRKLPCCSPTAPEIEE
jgi:hypothetical protein